MRCFNALPILLLAEGLSCVSAAVVQKRQSTKRSINYSGAALLASPDGTPFNYVAAQISVPTSIYVNAEGGDDQKAAAWVGFGGGDSSTSNGILQTGCTFNNDGQDDQYTQCWYEFYPTEPQFFDGFSPSPGDTIQLELYRDSDTQGHAYITNLNTGEAVDSPVTAPDGHSAAGTDADWIVEDPGAIHGVANFVNFQKEFFEGCQVLTEAGNSYGPGDDTYVVFNEFKNLGDGNGPQKWTNSFLPSDSEVEVDWVSPYS